MNTITYPCHNLSHLKYARSRGSCCGTFAVNVGIHLLGVFTDARFRHLFTSYDAPMLPDSRGWVITEWMEIKSAWPSRSRLECVATCRFTDGCDGSKFDKTTNICAQVA